jgi:hypothetical protein
MKHKITMLHQTEDIQVYRCNCCRHYNVNYRNLFMVFTYRELKSFIEMLKSLEGHHYNCIHPEGHKAVISNSRFDSNGMGFTAEETQYIISQVEQAMIIDQVNKALLS